MRERHTPPPPLKRGGSDAVFLLVMKGLWRGGFPSREGRWRCFFSFLEGDGLV